MCGISGLIDFRHASSPESLEKMTNCLAHRGPEYGRSEFLESSFAQVGFGHRRLSIIDLSDAGRQPMHHGDLSITFNGEIYNYRELQKELRSLGRSFTNNSDTEVILQAFAEW